jgi:hypothetical protein
MPTLLVRGASLLAVAFLLNIGLNAHILWKIHSSNLDLNPLRFIFGSDILFLAGFSVLVLVLIRNFIRKFAYSAILLALLVVIATPYVNKVVLTDGGSEVHPGVCRWWTIRGRISDIPVAGISP